MKHTLIAGLFALATATTALAAPDDMHKYHERHMERLSSELQLTTEQQEQVRAVHKEQFDKMKELHQEKQEKIRAILTDEQRTQWEELREERRDKMKKHMKDRKDKRGERNADANSQ